MVNSLLVTDAIKSGCFCQEIVKLLKAPKWRWIFTRFAQKGLEREDVIEKVYRHFKYVKRCKKSPSK